ncbi:MAG TPA: hypothetical protein VJN43_00680 [Bryobacteraceae bacterium]|nr:hypothetical protein [Bryobacteraceae bacterium]
MKREEIEKLLGGYATGTLTGSERDALFQAALEDQNLFDELAGETALKELLEDPDARAFLLQALPEEPEQHNVRWNAWRWASAWSAAAAVVVVGAVLLRTPAPQVPAASNLASLKTVAPREENADQIAPLPAAAQKKPELKTRTAASASSGLARPASPSPERVPNAVLPAPSPPAAAAPPVVNQERAETAKSLPAPIAPASTPPKQADAVTLTVAAGTLKEASSESKAGARQLFYSSPEQATALVESRETLQRSKLAGVSVGTVPVFRYTLVRRLPDATFAETDPSTLFHAGDALRIIVETNSPGFVAVWEDGRALANLPVLARTKYTIPSEGAIDLYGPPGDRKLLIVFSRRSENRPAALSSAVLVEQSGEHATYVAEPHRVPRVSFEIPLNYR